MPQPTAADIALDATHSPATALAPSAAAEAATISGAQFEGQSEAKSEAKPKADAAPDPKAHLANGDSAQARPQRVVSMNLCTDQLAMLLAAPGQLVSVSILASDPLSSAMPDEAQSYHANHGLAEEIFLLRPDLVLTEPYTRPATVDLLRQLGIRVALIQPVSSLSEISQALSEVGQALGREDAAQRVAGDFHAKLADLVQDAALPEQVLPLAGAQAPQISDEAPSAGSASRRRAAIYHANGYTTGKATLGGDVLEAAGLQNITDEFGMTWGGLLPLEQLVLAQPDIIVSGTPYTGRSRAEDLLAHPALSALRRGKVTARASDADWICGTPHVLNAVSAMRDLRRKAEE